MEEKYLKYKNKYLSLRNTLRLSQYGGAGGGGGDWACQACTFANERNSNACAVCQTAKGKQAGPNALGTKAFHAAGGVAGGVVSAGPAGAGVAGGVVGAGAAGGYIGAARAAPAAPSFGAVVSGPFMLQYSAHATGDDLKPRQRIQVTMNDTVNTLIRKIKEIEGNIPNVTVYIKNRPINGTPLTPETTVRELGLRPGSGIGGNTLMVGFRF